MKISLALPCPLAARRLRAALVTLLLALACLGGTAACGEDGEDEQLVSELDNAGHVAECNATRAEVGTDALLGFAHYTCLAASTIGGSCNMNVFENCVQVAVTACAAPPAASPLRSCGATVAELHACAVAKGAQYAAYRNTNCTTPATTAPKPEAELAACAALCSKCPGACPIGFVAPPGP
jgi:hypothetical protein